MILTYDDKLGFQKYFIILILSFSLSIKTHFLIIPLVQLR